MTTTAAQQRGQRRPTVRRRGSVLHRNAEAGREIGMREVEARLVFGGHRESRERDVDLVLLDGFEQAFRIIVVLAELEIALQLGRDLLPEIDDKPFHFPSSLRDTKGGTRMVPTTSLVSAAIVPVAS